MDSLLLRKSRDQAVLGVYSTTAAIGLVGGCCSLKRGVCTLTWHHPAISGSSTPGCFSSLTSVYIQVWGCSSLCYSGSPSPLKLFTCWQYNLTMRLVILPFSDLFLLLGCSFCCCCLFPQVLSLSIFRVAFCHLFIFQADRLQFSVLYGLTPHRIPSACGVSSSHPSLDVT